MNWIFFQVGVLLFALFMLYYTYLCFRKKQLLKQDWIFWSVLWIVGVILVWFPQSLEGIIEALHIARVLDLVFMVSFLLVFLLLFLLYKNSRQARKTLETLVERIALMENK